MTLRTLLATALLASALPTSAAEWTLADAMPIPGNSTERIQASQPAGDINRQGFFSDLSFEPATRTWFALSDRGPGGDVIGYATRVQQMLIPIHPITGEMLTSPIVLRTILFTDRDGQPFNGLNPTLLNGSPNILGRSFDPEGFAIGRNGHFFVADEYGPSLYEFDRRGRFLRAFEIPRNLRSRQADGQENFSDGRPTIVRGRQDNRGLEGQTLNASGTRLYAVMQDPLVDEGSSGDGRRSRWVRIVEFDVRSAVGLAQYACPLESIATLNAIDPATTDDFSATNQVRRRRLVAQMSLLEGATHRRALGLCRAAPVPEIRRCVQFEADTGAPTGTAGANGLMP